MQGLDRLRCYEARKFETQAYWSEHLDSEEVIKMLEELHLPEKKKANIAEGLDDMKQRRNDWAHPSGEEVDKTIAALAELLRAYPHVHHILKTVDPLLPEFTLKYGRLKAKMFERS